MSATNWWWLAGLVLCSGLGSCVGAPAGTACAPPAPGGCSTDGDCIVAYCADAVCSCGGFAIAKAQLGENACLAAYAGSSPGPAPSGCLPGGIPCECPAAPKCAARCVSGTCFCADGGFG
jgi:hypothetical protein